MDAVKTITLAEPIIGHEGPITTVVVREPRFEEYRQLGDPFIIAETPDGTPYVVERDDVVRQYEEILIVEPKTTALLQQGGWRLARQIRQTILGFFLGGASAGAASTTSPMNSSSGEGSRPST